MKDEDLKNYENMLPESAIPICGFRLLSYMKEDGTIHYVFAHAGNIAVSHLIGLMDMAKQDVAITAILASRSDESDEE